MNNKPACSFVEEMSVLTRGDIDTYFLHLHERDSGLVIPVKYGHGRIIGRSKLLKQTRKLNLSQTYI